MSCLICTEKYNISNHFKVCCMYCQFESCRKCCETYIVNERVAKCMNTECVKEWTRKFLADNFTKKFIKTTWKNNLEIVGLEKEKALLPATQGIVETIIEREKIKVQIDELDRLMRELGSRRLHLNIEYNRYGNARYAAANERKQFIRACPEEHCRGFLSSQWKCGLCGLWTCPECHVVKGERQDMEHTCDTNDLETAKLLEKDTKSCPKCGTGIFKIDGCDQIWCTQCHTAFSWRTGRIETHIHNPHYYEWQRRNNGGTAPREVGDFQCGQEITHHTAAIITSKIRKIYNENQLSDKIKVDLLCMNIGNIIRSTLHLHRVQLPVYQVNHVEDNQGLRVEYLRNRISEEEFKIKIQRASKQHNKKREIGEVVHLFIQSVTDIMYRLHEELNEKEICNTNAARKALIEELETYVKEVYTLQDYTDECFSDIAKAYGCKQRRIRMLNDKNRYCDVLIT